MGVTHQVIVMLQLGCYCRLGVCHSAKIKGQGQSGGRSGGRDPLLLTDTLCESGIRRYFPVNARFHGSGCHAFYYGLWLKNYL